MTKDRDDDVPIQIDGYKIKIRVAPQEGQERPKSWREVRDRVNRSLMTLAAGIPDFAATVVEGASNAVRAILNLPAAVVRRIDAGRSQADEREGRAQELIESGEPPRDPEVALRQLEAVLEKIRVQGLTAEIHVRDDGSPVVITGRPEMEELSGEVIKALPSSTTEGKGAQEAEEEKFGIQPSEDEYDGLNPS